MCGYIIQRELEIDETEKSVGLISEYHGVMIKDLVLSNFSVGSDSESPVGGVGWYYRI